jgi:hypothetical protein
MDFEDVVVPLVFLVIGVGGWLLITQAIGAANVGSWAFTGHELAATMLPFISWLWLIGCILISGYSLWRHIN